MSPERYQPVPPSPELAPADPSASVGNIQRNVDPNILMLATNPEAVPAADKAAAFAEAKKQSYNGGEKVILTDKKGESRWGKEYGEGEVFTFDSSIRGSFDKVPADREDWTGAMQLTSDIEGRYNNVIIETDDGHKILIRRTNDRASASKQTFELISTSQEAGKDGEPVRLVPIDTEMLKDVVIVPGEGMVLGVDPKTGQRIRSRGAVTKVTVFGTNDDDRHKVNPNHPFLVSRPEMQRNALQEFNETLLESRRGKLAPTIGREAESGAGIEEPVATPEDDATDQIDRELDQILSEGDPDVGLSEEAAQQRIRGMHDLARLEGRPLTDAEKFRVRQILNGVTSESNPTQEGTDAIDAELRQIIDESNIDLAAATVRYSQQARDRIQEMHTAAKSEGRALTDAEKRQVQLILESVRDQEAVAQRLAA